MHTTTLAGAVLALCVPALAQGFITTPRGGLTREGPHSAAMFGVYDIARYQQADAMHTGSKPYTLTQIAFRLDNRDHTSVTATGRTWTTSARRSASHPTRTGSRSGT